MERSSIENYDGYLQMKSDLNEQKSKCTQQLLEVDKELQELRAQKAISASKLSKAKSDYEALLKSSPLTIFQRVHYWHLMNSKRRFTIRVFV